MQEEKPYSTSIGAISASLYVSFQVIANVLSTKIAVLPLVNWAIDGGTVLYPLTFTLRDFVHKSLGKKISRHIVLLAGGVNALMVLVFLLVGAMQPDPSWPYQQAYEHILLPVWRITTASIVAQIVSELIDTEIFSFMYKRFSDLRAVLISNTASLVIDSLLFIAIAFGGSLPTQVLVEIFLTNIIVKFILSLVSTPSITLIPRRVEFDEM